MKSSHIASTIGVLLIVAGAAWLALSFNRTGSTETSGLGTNTASSADTAQNQEPMPTALATTPASSPATPTPSPSVSAVSSAVFAPYVANTLRTGDLGTGSAEFSGVALNEDRNRLLIVDDEGQLFEFDLGSDGLPVVPARRTIRITAGGGDTEGIAWVGESTYAIANENDGTVMFVVINDDTVEITDQHVDRVVTAAGAEREGNGIEGVAILRSGRGGGAEFAVVIERPAQVVFVNGQGPTGNQHLFGELSDASDLWIDADGMLSVLSDEGQALHHFSAAGDGVYRQVDMLDLVFEDGAFAQPEGLVYSLDGTRLYVVGEAPQPGSYTFGYFVQDDPDE